jgi:hypothetical protein
MSKDIKKEVIVLIIRNNKIYGSTKKRKTAKYNSLSNLVPGAGIEPARPQQAQDFKSCVSTSSTIRATLLQKQKKGGNPSQSEKRDSNSRPQPWQGCALPTELFSHNLCIKNVTSFKCSANISRSFCLCKFCAYFFNKVSTIIRQLSDNKISSV